jgi:hypothetical protein
VQKAHLRHDLLRQAIEEARRHGLVTRSEYNELMREFKFDAAVAAAR